MLALTQGMVTQLLGTPQAPPARAPNPPAVVVRQPGAAARNPWAAPSHTPRSIPAGDCDKCRSHINNICLHTKQDGSVPDRSDILPPSPGPPPATLEPQWPQGLPAGAMERWVEAQGRQIENASEGEDSLDQMLQDEASAAGAQIDYAESAASSSWSPIHSLHKALTKLQRAILKVPESGAKMKGTKQISIETKNITESARKLLEKV